MNMFDFVETRFKNLFFNDIIFKNANSALHSKLYIFLLELSKNFFVFVVLTFCSGKHYSSYKNDIQQVFSNTDDVKNISWIMDIVHIKFFRDFPYFFS